MATPVISTAVLLNSGFALELQQEVVSSCSVMSITSASFKRRWGYIFPLLTSYFILLRCLLLLPSCSDFRVSQEVLFLFLLLLIIVGSYPHRKTNSCRFSFDLHFLGHLVRSRDISGPPGVNFAELELEWRQRNDPGACLFFCPAMGSAFLPLVVEFRRVVLRPFFVKIKPYQFRNLVNPAQYICWLHFRAGAALRKRHLVHTLWSDHFDTNMHTSYYQPNHDYQ